MSDLLIGLAEIARYLRVPLSTMKKQSARLQRLEVLFVVWRGRPLKPRICSTKDRLEAWLIASGGRIPADE